jgi:hypothetical protein
MVLDFASFDHPQQIYWEDSQSKDPYSCVDGCHLGTPSYPYMLMMFLSICRAPFFFTLVRDKRTSNQHLTAEKANPLDDHLHEEDLDAPNIRRGP